MKKYLLLLIFFTGFFAPRSYSQCIPDQNFRQIIGFQCPTCIDTDGCLTPDAEFVTALDVMQQNIADITGIEGFTHLEQFYCNDNVITFIPPLPDSLTLFYCSDNLITSLPSSLPPKLEQFKCENNQITSVPPLPATIKLFYCSGNNLSSLPDLPENLDNLTCNDNYLTSLPPLPSALTSLHCNSNPLYKLPSLPENLEKLYCSKDHLDGLPELPATITILDVSHNPISCLPKLPDGLTLFNYDSTYVSCFPNLPVAFDNDTVLHPPLCVNENGDSCALNPVISGTVYVDYNGNEVKDLGDIGFPGVHVIANSGNWMGYTDADGKYTMKTGLSNTFIMSTVIPPGVYTSSPVGYTYTFDDSTGQSISNLDFGLYPDPIDKDLSVQLIPGPIAPGIETNYHITYTNQCPFPLDGTLQFQYDYNDMEYVSTDVVPTASSYNFLSWDFTALPPFTSKTITVTLDIPSNILAGTKLNNSVSGILSGTSDINPGNNYQSDSSTVYTVPLTNYKFVNRTMLTPEELANGKDLKYSIYFQNSGTDSATDLEIIDTLSVNLSAPDFTLLSSSHPVTFELTNDPRNPAHPLILHWKFTGINLPPYSSDPLNSVGFVTFREKPLSSLFLGNKIDNTATLSFSNSSALLPTNSVTTNISYPILVSDPQEGVTDWEIFPNPTDGLFNFNCRLSVPGIVTLKIYNALSESVWEKQISALNEITVPVDLQQLPAGPYLLRLTGTNVNASQKILKF